MSLYCSFYADLSKKMGVFINDHDTKCICEFVTHDNASYHPPPPSLTYVAMPCRVCLLTQCKALSERPNWQASGGKTEVGDGVQVFPRIKRQLHECLLPAYGPFSC